MTRTPQQHDESIQEQEQRHNAQVRKGNIDGCSMSGLGNAYVAPPLASTRDVQCGPRVWDALNGGLELARAESASRMRIEHLLLQILRDPAMITIGTLQLMQLPASTLFTTLARISRELEESTNSPRYGQA